MGINISGIRITGNVSVRGISAIPTVLYSENETALMPVVLAGDTHTFISNISTALMPASLSGLGIVSFIGETDTAMMPVSLHG